MSARFRIGIDLGGTKIEGAAIDACGSVRFRHRVATPSRDYRGTIDAIIALIRMIEQEIGTTAPVGIGIPGAVSPATGLIKNANSTWLIGRPLQRDIESALGRPTRLANDANCFALSEATDGAGAAMETVFGVILGTGVGGGTAISLQILAGANAIAGAMAVAAGRGAVNFGAGRVRCYRVHACIAAALRTPVHRGVGVSADEDKRK